MQRHRTLALLATTAMALVACGSAPDDGSPVAADRADGTAATPNETPTTAAPLPTPPEHVDPFELPADPDALIIELRVGEQRGAAEINDVSVTADGRVYFPLEGPARFSPPRASAAQPFVVRQLTPDGLSDLVEFALDSGLFNPAPDYGDSSVTDQATTRVTAWSSLTSISHSAYGLEFAAYDEQAEQHRELLRGVTARLFELRSLEDPTVIGPAVAFESDAWTVTAVHGFPSSSSQPQWPLDAEATGPCVDLDPASFDDGVIPGEYVVAGSEQPHPDLDDVTTRLVVEVVPAFPWTEC